MFVTNNSTKSRAGYLKKFTGLGLNVSAVHVSPILYYLSVPAKHYSHVIIHARDMTKWQCCLGASTKISLLRCCFEQIWSDSSEEPVCRIASWLSCQIVLQEEIYSSSYAAAAYLESIKFPKDKKVDFDSLTWGNHALLSTENGKLVTYTHLPLKEGSPFTYGVFMEAKTCRNSLVLIKFKLVSRIYALSPIFTLKVEASVPHDIIICQYFKYRE